MSDHRSIHFYFMDKPLHCFFRLQECLFLICCIKDCLPARRADSPGCVPTKQEVTLSQPEGAIYMLVFGTPVGTARAFIGHVHVANLTSCAICGVPASG